MIVITEIQPSNILCVYDFNQKEYRYHVSDDNDFYPFGVRGDYFDIENQKLVDDYFEYHERERFVHRGESFEDFIEKFPEYFI